MRNLIILVSLIPRPMPYFQLHCGLGMRLHGIAVLKTVQAWERGWDLYRRGKVIDPAIQNS